MKTWAILLILSLPIVATADTGYLDYLSGIDSPAARNHILQEKLKDMETRITQLERDLTLVQNTAMNALLDLQSRLTALENKKKRPSKE